MVERASDIIFGTEGPIRSARSRPYSRSCSERGFAHVAGIPAELSGYQKNSSIYTISNHCRFVLVFRRALLFRNIQPLYRPNPRPRTSNFCLCSRLRKSSWLLSTPKIKLLMILTPRIVSVFHVISSKIHSIAAKCSQGCLYGFPPNPVKCLSTYFLVLFIFQFAPHVQAYRLHRERSLT